MRQGEITFTMSISTFMKNGNLGQDYFLEFKVGAGGWGLRFKKENELLKNNDTCDLWGVQVGSFFKPPAIKSVDQAGGQTLEPHFCRSGKAQLLLRAVAVQLHDCSVLGHGYVTSTFSLPPTFPGKA